MVVDCLINLMFVVYYTIKVDGQSDRASCKTEKYKVWQNYIC